VNEAWFSALGEPLDEGEMAELAAYLQGLGPLGVYDGAFAIF
jgi:hypothetical protein